MQSKIPSKKSSKESVVVFNSHDQLQLRFLFGGRCRYISLSLPKGKAEEAIANHIFYSNQTV